MELAAFVLDLNNNFSEAKEKAWDFIVLATLWHEKGRRLSKDYIVRRIEEVFGFKNIPLYMIEGALTRLHDEGYVASEHVGKKELFILTSRGMDKARSILKKRKQIENKAMKIFVKILKKQAGHRLKSSDIETAKSRLYEFLGKIFEERGVFASKLLIERIFVSTISQNVLKDLVSDIKEPLRSTLEYAVKEFLKKCPEDEILAKFIASLAQSYLIIQLLNLDPELKKLERRSLANITLIIDTNIIIPLLCEAHEAHEYVKEVLKYIKDIGIRNLYITKHTRNEFIRRLEYSKNLYSLYKDGLFNLSEGVKKRAVQLITDPFIKTYFKRTIDYPAYSWDVFVSEMENFVQILKDKYEIFLDDRDYNISSDEPMFQKLVEAVNTANPKKPIATVEHDAMNILIVDQLRKSSPALEIIGPRYWFLTRDRTLYIAEVVLLKRSPSSSIHIIDWLCIISPFISADTSKTVAELLRSPLLMEEWIDPEQVLFGISVLGPLLEDPSISLETIKGIIGSTYMKKYFEGFEEKLRKYKVLRIEGIKEEELRQMLKVERENEIKKIREEILKEVRKEIRRKTRHKDLIIILLGISLALAISYIIITLYANIIIGVISGIFSVFVLSLLSEAVKATFLFALRKIWRRAKSVLSK